MSETAGTVISDSLQELLVQAVEQPIQPVEASTSIRYLNRMMAAWETRGINLGYTTVTSLGDQVTVPDGALEAIVFALAIKSAPQYDVPVSIDLRQNAKDAFKSVLRLSVTKPNQAYPSTLPIGSGNEGDYYDDYSHFYPGLEKEILSETSGPIVQESSNVN